MSLFRSFQTEGQIDRDTEIQREKIFLTKRSNVEIISHRIASQHIASHRIVSYRIVSYRIVSYRIVSYRIVSYRIVSYRIVSYRIVSYRIVSYRIVSYRIVSYRIVSYRIVSYRIVSYRVARILHFDDRSLHRAYPSLHSSGVPEQLNIKAVAGAGKLIDGCSLALCLATVSAGMCHRNKVNSIA